MDLNDIAVFAAVVRAKGFTAAARQLDLQPSVVSRRVARLEDELGFKLLHRTTRRVGLTEAGRLFYARTSSITSIVEEAVTAVKAGQQAPTGVLRITAPPDDGGVIWGLLSGFLRDNPRVDVEIIHTLDAVDLIENDIDVALRGGSVPDTAAFTAHLLFESRILLAASPTYLAAHGTPQKVEELESHLGICMDAWAPNAIRRLDGDQGLVRLSMRNRVRANGLQTAHRAALDGVGIAPLLELTCWQDLRRGSLVEVLQGALPPSAEMWLIARLPRERSAAATALVRHILAVAPSFSPRS